jgi:hypothetical protein
MNSTMSCWFAGAIGATALINRLRDAFECGATAAPHAVTTIIN